MEARPLAAKLNFNSSSNNVQGMEALARKWNQFGSYSRTRRYNQVYHQSVFFTYFFVSAADAVFLEGARKIQS